MKILSSDNKSYEQLATMRKVNSAADNAAGLSILEKMNSRKIGLNTGTDNAQAGKDMYQVAEGGLQSITENLQRIRELSLQSKNITYGADEKKAIQEEIEALKASIQDAAKGTQFNTLKLLDGSMADKMLATSPDGSGMQIQLSNATLQNLGIADYDITGEFSINTIDHALRMVNDARASIGASTNRLDHNIQYNNYAAINIGQSVSRIRDTDVGASVSDLKRNQILDQYRMFAMRAKNNQMSNSISRLLGT